MERIRIFSKPIILVIVSVILSGCTLLGYKKVTQYPEPTENEPRTKVLLVSDYGGSLFGIIDFYVLSADKGTLYLHAEGEKTNKPKVKNLGIDMKVPGKNKINQVYLPTDVDIQIGAYGQTPKWGGYSYCSSSKKINLEQNKEYALSFDNIEAGKTYCIMSLYEIIIDQNNEKTLKPVTK